MNPHLTAALAYARIADMQRQADSRRRTAGSRKGPTTIHAFLRVG